MGPEHPDTLNTMNSLAVTYAADGQLDKAVPLHEQTLKLRKAILGPEHPDTLSTMNSLAVAHHDSGRLDQALPLYEQTLALTQAKLGPDHPNTLTFMTSLALAYREADDHNGALQIAQSALNLPSVQSAIGPDALKRKANFVLIAAHSLNQLTRWQEAESLAREAVAIRQELMPGKWGYFNARTIQGEALLGLKRYEEAERALISGYNGLKEREQDMPGNQRQKLLSQAGEHLVKLYEAWDKPEEAATWQTDLEQFLAEPKNNKQSEKQ